MTMPNRSIAQPFDTSDASSHSISLLGVTRNSDNYGVRVLLSAAVEAAALAFPDSPIVALDYGRFTEMWDESLPSGVRHVRLINLRFSWKIHLPNNGFRLLAIVALSRALPRRIREAWWHRNPWLRAIVAQRVHLAIAGGDSFSDIYGLRRLLYVTLPQLLVLLLNRPLVQLPQTYGPFRTRLAKLIARTILRKSHTIFSRDEAGVLSVRTLLRGRSPEIHVVHDIGFAMSPQPLEQTLIRRLSNLKQESPLIGINPSSLLMMGGYSGANMFGLRERFGEVVDALVGNAISELGAHVLLIPHVVGGPKSQEDEWRLCCTLATQYRLKYGARVSAIETTLDHRQTKALIGHTDLFLGGRMHACVAAVSQGVPTVCLAYSDKFAGVMAPFGEAAHVIDLRAESTREISSRMVQQFRRRLELRQDLDFRLKKSVPFAEILRTRLSVLLATNGQEIHMSALRGPAPDPNS